MIRGKNYLPLDMAQYFPTFLFAASSASKSGSVRDPFAILSTLDLTLTKGLTMVEHRAISSGT